jgi:hypothetical protein
VGSASWPPRLAKQLERLAEESLRQDASRSLGAGRPSLLPIAARRNTSCPKRSSVETKPRSREFKTPLPWGLAFPRGGFSRWLKHECGHCSLPWCRRVWEPPSQCGSSHAYHRQRKALNLKGCSHRSQVSCLRRRSYPRDRWCRFLCPKCSLEPLKRRFSA